jgi:iron complex transport system substrate-binding protein
MRYPLLLWCCAVLTSCAPGPADERLFEEIILQPRYAKGFDVRKKGENYQVVFYSPGDPGKPHPVEVSIPYNRIACGSTTHLGLFASIGQLARIKATAYAHLVKDPEITKFIDHGLIANLSSSDDLDKEILFSVKPDLLLTVPFSPVNPELLGQSGITCLPISEYLEEDPLGRAEWIRLIGFLCGQMETGDTVFKTIETNYLALRNEITIKTGEKPEPSVVFLSHEGGEWFAPPSNSAISRIIDDAGARYFFNNIQANSNIRLSAEELISQRNDIDWWGALIYSGPPVSRKMIEQNLPDVEALQRIGEDHLFYCNSAQSDYFGRAMLEPDVLLAELTAIFHPEIRTVTHPAYFHRAE